MRTSAIRAGDIVLCDKRGRLFHARVVELDAGAGLVVEPIERNISYRHVDASDVTGHWTRSTTSRRPARTTPAAASSPQSAHPRLFEAPSVPRRALR